ncbi:putative ribonuclease H-like domain-containing protein [Tanacetum coccineum]
MPIQGKNDGKKRDSFYQDQGAGKKEQNQNCLLTMDDGVVNWGEQHKVRKKKKRQINALMANQSNTEVSYVLKHALISYNKLKTLCDEQMNHLRMNKKQEILAYTLAVKKLESSKLVTFQKQQLSLNEQLTFQANEIYAKDEKLKRYRRIGMKAVKEKEQLFQCTQKDFLNKTFITVDFSKDDNFKGVPHPLTGDYTPKPQEEIDDSLYVYGKKGPQKPEISDSDDNSTEHSTCQSNDSEGSFGNPSEHSSESESESISVPNEMSASNLSHLIKDCDYYEKKMAREAEFKKQRVFNTGNRVAKPVWTNANRVNHANQFVSLRSVKLNAWTEEKFDSGCTGHILVTMITWMILEECKGDLLPLEVALLTLLVKEEKNVDLVGYSSWLQRMKLVTSLRTLLDKLNHRVKILRSDNGTEFKNRDMLELCGNKGIKQEYSNARTPQQNEVAERMNKTLIEAARTMLANSLLPTNFWAEAVSTACYIFNRVRVTKPQNKTPYELLLGHKPIISYIRPFGCHITILDTLSVLGKFDGKYDDGFLVGYSLNSKAFRVYNLVTKKVEVNLHVKFLKEKPNVKGVGYRWMFDIDYLTDSMKYIPVSLENQTNQHAGTSEVTNPNAGTSEVTTSAGTLQTPNANASEEEDEAEDLIIVPTALQNLKTQEKEAYSTSISKDTPEILAFRRELDDLAQKHLREVPKNKDTNTNLVNFGSGIDDAQPADQDDSDMPELTIFNKPQQGIFDEASYDDEGMVHDFNNLPTEVAISPIPTLRIHNIHPQSQILGDPKSSVQTRSRVQQHSEAHALISKALQDDSLVEAMQEELLQFRLQQVWILVDLPHGAKVIGTKLVYRNKRDEKGVVVRNKARLMAQGHRREEGKTSGPMTMNTMC